MTSPSDLVALVARLRSPDARQADSAVMEAAAAIEQLQAELATALEDASELRALDNEAQHGADALRAELAAVKWKIDELFPVIAHGDDKHRAWLKDAIEKHFDAARAQAGGK